MIIPTYFPAQPEIQQHTLYYEELKPTHLWVKNDIALFYQFKTEPNSPTILSLIPDGCFDFLFCCDPSKPSAFLWTSPFHRKKQPEFEKNCSYFGVRFFPEQSIIKLNYPMNELLAQQIPLIDVMSNIECMIEEMTICNSFYERIDRFEQYMRKHRQEMGKDLKLVRYAIDQIYSSRAMVNVHELSGTIGFSEQHIRRKFESYIGFSPKQFCQIVRLQNCLNKYLKSDGSDLLDIIYENGYYDQAHFIKGFKKFINLTPKQYKKFFSEKIV